MAKKIKPVSEECQVIENSIAQDSIYQTDKMQSTRLPDPIRVNPYALSEDQKRKIEMYDQIEESNKQLIKENLDLKEKIANYILEINNFKSDTLSKSNNSELAQLKIDYKTLQEASDSYLMKISDLTFENAKLNAQLKELSNSFSSGQKINNNLTQESKIEKPVYNPYRTNGYSSWN